jgi:hypothetical protein
MHLLTYRLRGSGVFRFRALALGSNSFMTDSDTGAVGEEVISSSVRGSGNSKEAVCWETLRLEKGTRAVLDEMRDLGRDLLRTLEGSRAAMA